MIFINLCSLATLDTISLLAFQSIGHRYGGASICQAATLFPKSALVRLVIQSDATGSHRPCRSLRCKDSAWRIEPEAASVAEFGKDWAVFVAASSVVTRPADLPDVWQPGVPIPPVNVLCPQALFPLVFRYTVISSCSSSIVSGDRKRSGCSAAVGLSWALEAVAACCSLLLLEQQGGPRLQTLDRLSMSRSALSPRQAYLYRRTGAGVLARNPLNRAKYSPPTMCCGPVAHCGPVAWLM